MGKVIGDFLKEEPEPSPEGLYGDGEAASEIVRVLGDALSSSPI